jgi:hypothetical protein
LSSFVPSILEVEEESLRTDSSLTVFSQTGGSFSTLGNNFGILLGGLKGK